jgi:hypothetical protein
MAERAAIFNAIGFRSPFAAYARICDAISAFIVEVRFASGRAFGMGCHSASLAGQAMNRYRGTQAEFQFSIVAPHTAHSKLLISRASAMCSLRS